MSELQPFSLLVGDIYDAALEPALWSSVLEKLCRFVPASYGNIFIQDSLNHSANSVFSWGIDPQFFGSYLQTYARINPLFPATFFQPVGEVFSSNDIMPHAQYERTRFYREWVEPQGLVDNVAVILEKSATSCAMLALPLTAKEGTLSEEGRARMQLLVPHVQRAVLIGKAFDLQSAAAADFAATVEAIAAAIYLVDANARIVHANRSGHALLAADDVLCSVNGHLHAHDRGADLALGKQFAAATSDDAMVIDPGGPATHVPSRLGDHYAAHVLPLTSGARRATGAPHRAAAAVFVHKAAPNQSAPVEVLAKAYRLSPRELGVMLAVTEVGGVAEVAAMLGLSQATIKTHLRQIFAKTGTSRQSELVKLVVGFMSPVR